MLPEYLDILDSPVESAWIYNFKNGELGFSNQWKERIGAGNIMPSGMKTYLMSLIHPDDLNMIKQADEAAFAGRPLKLKYEYRVRLTSGEYIWVYSQGRILYDQNGELEKVYGISLDITERKIIESVKQTHTMIIQTINDICKQTMSSATPEDFINACKEIFKSITQSKYCIIIQSSKNAVQHQAAGCPKIDELCREVLQNGQSMLVNGEKCPFLGVPYTREGPDAEMIAVAGRSGGYTVEIRELLESIIPIFFEALHKKRVEESVRNDRLLMRTIIDSASDFLFVKDKASRIVMVNQAYGGAFGVDINDVIGKDDYQLYSNHEAARSIIENDRLVMQTGQTHEFEESVMTPYGPKTYSLSKVPWRDSAGNIIGIVGIAHDITDLKQREAELRAIKDDLAKEVATLKILHSLYSNFIIQNHHKTIFKDVLNALTSITDAKKGSMQLFNEHEKTLNIILAHGLSDNFIGYFRCIGLDMGPCGKAYKEKRRIIVPDVAKYPVFRGKPALKYLIEEGVMCQQSTPLISSSGKFVGVMNTYYPQAKQFEERELRILDMLARMAADVIERANTEEALKIAQTQTLELVEELKEADHNKDKFISVLSHELRNPLSAISAGIQILDITQDRTKTNNARVIMKRQIDQLCKLVDDLLDLTRITQNKIRLKKEYIKLNEIVKNTAEDIKPEYEKKGVHLIIKTCPGTVVLLADPVRMVQILGNVLYNSLKFTPYGGTVFLTLMYDYQYAIINIKDNGIGISPDVLPRLFEPFTQAEDTLDRRNGGLGLGLSIVKGIIDLHGGNVSVHSEGLGKGSEFTLRLPIT